MKSVELNRCRSNISKGNIIFQISNNSTKNRGTVNSTQKYNIIILHGRFINADLPEDVTTVNSSTKTRKFLKTVDPRYTP